MKQRYKYFTNILVIVGIACMSPMASVCFHYLTGQEIINAHVGLSILSWLFGLLILIFGYMFLRRKEK